MRTRGAGREHGGTEDCDACADRDCAGTQFNGCAGNGHTRADEHARTGDCHAASTDRHAASTDCHAGSPDSCAAHCYGARQADCRASAIAGTDRHSSGARQSLRRATQSVWLQLLWRTRHCRRAD